MIILCSKFSKKGIWLPTLNVKLRMTDSSCVYVLYNGAEIYPVALYSRDRLGQKKFELYKRCHVIATLDM